MIDFKELKKIMNELFEAHDNGRYLLYPEKKSISDFKMCRYSALLTSMVLTELTDEKWGVEGGSVWEPFLSKGGFFDGESWHGHYWSTNGEDIIDMCVNQFGVSEGYIITSADDERYQENYSEEELKRDLDSVRGTVERWFDDLKSDGRLNIALKGAPRRPRR